MNADLIKYYNDRTKEYEKIYLKPERQSNIKRATTILQDTFSGKNVLEIACGTGFWTEKIARTADSIYATDINESVIQLARLKKYQKANVTFGIADIFGLDKTKRQESLFGGFIWSHIPLQDIKKFLQVVNTLVLPGGIVVLMDNNYVEGNSSPISKTDEHGNTFQIRRLENGSGHLVLKNFPTETFLIGQLETFAKKIKFIKLKYYWVAIYTTVNEE